LYCDNRIYHIKVIFATLINTQIKALWIPPALGSAWKCYTSIIPNTFFEDRQGIMGGTLSCPTNVVFLMYYLGNVNS
jgi:hypothetical protein